MAYYDTIRVTVVFSVFLAAPELWPTLIVFLTVAHCSISVAQINPHHLPAIVLGCLRLPVFECPILAPAANQLQPALFSFATYYILIGLIVCTDTIAHKYHHLISSIATTTAETPTTTPTLSRHSSDEEFQATVPNCPDCGRVYKSRQHQRYHECAPKISNDTQRLAHAADLDLKRHLYDKATASGVPQKRLTVVINFLESAKTQLALGKKLGFVWPEEVSGNKLSIHGASTLFEASLKTDETLRQQYYYYVDKEIEYLGGLSASEIPSPLREFLSPTLKKLVES